MDVPRVVRNGRGGEITGTIPVTLCAICDHDTPGAGPLITFLTVHEHITGANAQEFASYAQQWVDQVTSRVDPALLSEDEET